MITKMTGKLASVGDEAVMLEIGALEYEVLVPQFVRGALQGRRGESVTLHTLEYLEGNPMQGRLIPRLIGFRNEVEREFFELFCSVDGVGVRKALRALACSVPELARAIHHEDKGFLSGLPGVGEAIADRIVAKLRRKVAKFALLVEPEAPATPLQPDLYEQATQVLVTLGHGPAEARRLLASIAGSRRFDSVEEILNEIYKKTTP